MSRGLGRIQRACLDVLEQHPDAPLDSIAVTALVVGRETVTDAEHASVRRALRKLVKAGLVIDMQRRGWRSKRRHWASPATAAKYYEKMATMGWAESIPPEHRHLIQTAAKTAKATTPKRARKGRKKGG